MTQSSFKLDAVCVGPQRTASSWLHRVLMTHPALCLPRDVKETMFFDKRFEKGLAWYEWHFRHRTSDQYCGEVAPTYFDHEGARTRLFAHNPNLKVIVNVRSPITRAFSLYRHHLQKGRVRGSFADAVRQMPRIMTSGHYGEQCPRWEGAFGTARMLYIVQEDIEGDPGRVVEGVCAFLGVARIALPPTARGRLNVPHLPRYPWLARWAARGASALRARRLHRLVEFGKQLGLKKVYRGGDVSAARLTPELHAELLPAFSPDIDYLEARLGRDFSGWRRWHETGHQ